ncbi:MAG: lysozyme [Janthinobacterium lividum]
MAVSTKQKAGIGVVAVTAIALSTALVGPLEGRTLKACLDLGGVPTICDGITGTVNGQPVKLGQTATKEQCDGLLGERLGKALRVVDINTRLPLSPYQRAGLTSFVYNVGETAFRKSTLLKDLNRGNVASACNRLRAWVFIKGKDCRIAKSNCAGIVKRREIERQYCLDEVGR